MSEAITRLNAALEGRYRIERELGEGGMATVYLAEDIKHERKVALKVLKPELAAVVGAERFLAEIKTTAKLTHPHILPLHDSGEADSFVFYVMPYVEGESLRERLDREHQLPVDEAVKITTDLAEALDYAHRHEVIHRDIKPANVLLLEGKPVISDFGIALAVGVAGGGRLTETGLSLGTPHYMSPEQATGDQTVGSATDTYALGSVLYEMLVGEPPYPGTTAQAVLGKIIAGEPVSVVKHRPSVPANVDAAARRALERLPADRFTSAQEFARALEDPGFQYGEEAAVGAGAGVGVWNWLTMAFAALAAVTTLGFGWALLRPETPAPLARFSSPFEEGQLPSLFSYMEFTADGSALVYVGPGASGQGTQLWIRRWADLDATPIRGTEGAITPRLSPDGREVAFSAFPGPLRVVALDGGPSRTLVEQVYSLGDWTPDGNVYFHTFSNVLARIPATGGGSDAVEILTELLERERAHANIRVLPGGKMGVFQIWYALNGQDAEVWAIDLDTRERRFLTAGHSPRFASTGHLLFGTPDGVLMAAPIDPGTAELTALPVPVAEGFAIELRFGQMNYAVSKNGTMIYAAEGGQSYSPVWVERDGTAREIDLGWTVAGVPNRLTFALSPDSTRLALSILDSEGTHDLWVKQLDTGPLSRLTFEGSENFRANWSPDSQSLTFVSNREGDYDVWTKRADGSGTAELVLDREAQVWEGLYSPDGTWLVFREGANEAADIYAIRLGMDGVAVSLEVTEFQERSISFSPNGRWLAYVSDRSGRNEVFVRPFPDAAASLQQVSANGGTEPVWAHSGRELFYVNGANELVAVQVSVDPSFAAGRQDVLFSLVDYRRNPSYAQYQVTPDDQRFVMLRDAAVFRLRFILVENFFEELKRLVPN